MLECYNNIHSSRGQLSKSCWQAAGTGVVPMPLILGILRRIYGARSQRIQCSRSSMKLPSNLLNQLPPKFMNGAGHRPPGLACRGVALHSPRVHPFQCSSSNLWPHSRYRCPTFQRKAHDSTRLHVARWNDIQNMKCSRAAMIHDAPRLLWLV